MVPELTKMAQKRSLTRLKRSQTTAKLKRSLTNNLEQTKTRLLYVIH